MDMKNLAIYAVIAIGIFLVYINLTAAPKECEKSKEPEKSKKPVPVKPLSPQKFIETELQKKNKFILDIILKVTKMKKNNIDQSLINVEDKKLSDKYPNLQVNLSNPKNRIIAQKVAEFLDYTKDTYNPKKAANLMAEMV